MARASTVAIASRSMRPSWRGFSVRTSELANTQNEEQEKERGESVHWLRVARRAASEKDQTRSRTWACARDPLWPASQRWTAISEANALTHERVALCQEERVHQLRFASGHACDDEKHLGDARTARPASDASGMRTLTNQACDHRNGNDWRQQVGAVRKPERRKRDNSGCDKNGRRFTVHRFVNPAANIASSMTGISPSVGSLSNGAVVG